jgi:outer membrane protein assembly factor BamB
MDSFVVDEDLLNIDGTKISFEHKIRDAIAFNEIVVVRLEIPTNAVQNRNVVGVDETGTRRWTIPEAPNGSTEDNPYMDIYASNGELWAGTWHGMAYRVDVDTGELLDKEFRK